MPSSGMVTFCHMQGEINPSDVLSKHWGYTELWPRIKALLFCPGDTEKMFDDAPPMDDGELLDEGLPEEKGER